jgi:hypothetical protein
MSDPVLEDGDSEVNEAFAPCDQCGLLRWWDELESGDDGETWVCASCIAKEEN